MIEKSLLLREFSFATTLFGPNTTPKIDLGAQFPSKTIIEKRNQANLCYFDPYLDKAYEKDEIVLVGKNMYYKNIVLFIQRFQSLVTF